MIVPGSAAGFASQGAGGEGRCAKLQRRALDERSPSYCDSGRASPKHWTFHAPAPKAFLRRTAPKPLFTGRKSFAISANRLTCELSIRGFLPAPDVMKALGVRPLIRRLSSSVGSRCRPRLNGVATACGLALKRAVQIAGESPVMDP